MSQTLSCGCIGNTIDPRTITFYKYTQVVKLFDSHGDPVFKVTTPCIDQHTIPNGESHTNTVYNLYLFQCGCNIVIRVDKRGGYQESSYAHYINEKNMCDIHKDLTTQLETITLEEKTVIDQIRQEFADKRKVLKLKSPNPFHINDPDYHQELAFKFNQ